MKDFERCAKCPAWHWKRRLIRQTRLWSICSTLSIFFNCLMFNVYRKENIETKLHKTLLTLNSLYNLITKKENIYCLYSHYNLLAIGLLVLTNSYLKWTDDSGSHIRLLSTLKSIIASTKHKGQIHFINLIHIRLFFFENYRENKETARQRQQFLVKILLFFSTVDMNIFSWFMIPVHPGVVFF